MRKNTFYQLGRAMLFGITLLATLALDYGGSYVAKALDEPEMPPNDARVLPATVKTRQAVVERYLALAPDPSYAPGYYDTSVYMLGDVVVGIVLPESTGSSENWTVAEQNNVVSEIQAGLDWWKTTGGALASLTFEYDVKLSIPTTYEPITRPSSDDNLWINEVMSNLGYTSGDYWDKVYAYENDLRNQYQADWAFTIFVVDSSVDVDGRFTDDYFAYAYIGGPFMVMTYDNSTWGINSMDKVTAHETGHIFMAGDQYEESGCSTSRKYGYLGIVNGNCDTIINGVDDGASSIMKDNSWVVDSFARGQIGWRDSDFDSIPDVVDTSPVVTLAAYTPDPTVNKTLSYSGYARSPVYPHAVCGAGDWCYTKDVTTQSIKQVNYRVDGGAWNAAIAQDGAFNTDVEDFSFTTNALNEGTHLINLKALSSSGNVSATWNDSVTVTAPATSVGAGVYDDSHSAFTYTGFWATYTGTGPYNNTMRYSTTVGNEVSFSIDGQMFEIIYTGSTNRGTMDIYVDNVKVDTLDAYNPVLAWQRTWTSPVFVAGVHTVRLVHAGGAVVDLDAVEVFTTPPLPPLPLGAGKYDETNNALDYNGAWGVYSGAGPYNDTMRYSATVGNDVMFSIDGQMFKISYTGNPNRGTVDVYVDDVKVDVIDEYNATLAWQKTWTSPVLAAGVHTVKLVHATGAVIDLDAVEVFTTPPPPPTLEIGVYDDTYAGLVYSGSWVPYSGVGPYNNSLYYSTTPGSYVNFSINGEQFKLTYTGSTSRGTVDVYIDNVKVDTINEYSATLVWQKTWTSPILIAGVHTVKLVHVGGAIVDLDAVEVTLIPPILGGGTYDDNANALVYKGSWTPYATTGPYNDSLHYSTIAGNSVTFSMLGIQFRLIYTGNTNRGKVDVYVDDVKVDTLNEYKTTATWQMAWNSPVLSNGIHVIKLVHASGAVVDLDAVEIIVPTPPENDSFADAIVIDDVQYSDLIPDITLATTESGDPTIAACDSDEGDYSVWYKYTPATNGLLYIDTLESSYDTLVAIWHGSYPNLTLVACNDDSSLTSFQSEVAGAVNQGVTYYIEVIQYAKEASPRNPMNDNLDSLSAAPGQSTLVLNVQFIPSLGGIGVYDDANTSLLYIDSWATYFAPGHYAGTLHYSTTIGNTVTFAFSGEYFELLYTGNHNRGTLDVYIDGVKIDTINEYSAKAVLQKSWGGPTLSNGLHLVKLVHTSGSVVDVDAVKITTPPPPPGPLGAGKYDNTNSMLNYTSSWVAYTGVGPYNDTMHYSTTVGSDVTFTIDGQMFIITFTGNANRGNMDVYVDNTKVGTIAAYSPTLFWQRSWISPALSAGVHTVRLVHASGAVVDLDAVEIFSNPLVIYDDTGPEFMYTGTWTAYSGAGPFNGTLHYSTAPGSYVTFVVDSQFKILYTGNPNRGTIDVYVDNVKIASLNEYNATLVWQKTWTSPVLSAGVHTIKLVHVNGSIVDIDAIQLD